MQTKLWNVMVLAALAVLMVYLPFAGQQPQVSQPSIRGVWSVAEQTGFGRTSHPTPGFWIFTAKHYSIVAEGRDDVKRPVLEDWDHATAQQLLDVCAPFVAQFGAYEVKGDVLTLKILEAKNVDLVGIARLQRVKVDGGTLIIAPFESSDGKVPTKPVLLKLIRVE